MTVEPELEKAPAYLAGPLTVVLVKVRAPLENTPPVPPCTVAPVMLTPLPTTSPPMTGTFSVTPLQPCTKPSSCEPEMLITPLATTFGMLPPVP